MGKTINWENWQLDSEDYIISRDDGLPARHQGPWAKKKLDFLSGYLEFAIKATRGSAYYLDLFAGPGRNAWSRINSEFPGSPIRALTASHTFPGAIQSTGFNHLYFCNRSDLDYEILNRRVKARKKEVKDQIEIGTIHALHGDSNELIYDILEGIPTYGVIIVFADIQGPTNLPFRTVEALRSRHDKVDFYVLYPSGSLKRMLAYDLQKRRRHYHTITRFFGTEAWKPIVQKRLTDGQAGRMRRELLDLYQTQLKTLWEYVGVKPRKVKGPRGYFYHMVFATNVDFAEDASDYVGRAGQGVLFDE